MIETAYAALAAALSSALIAADFINQIADLKIDPTAAFEPNGDEATLIKHAALLSVRTNIVRTLLGGPKPRYVIERECRLELAACGPASDAARKAALIAAQQAVVALAVDRPTLSGAAERLALTEQTTDELPPNGEVVLLTFILRVRSGDPLGLSA